MTKHSAYQSRLDAIDVNLSMIEKFKNIQPNSENDQQRINKEIEYYEKRIQQLKDEQKRIEENIKSVLLSFAENMEEQDIFEEFLYDNITEVESFTLFFAETVQEYFYSDELPRSVVDIFQSGLDDQVKYMFHVLFPDDSELKEILENGYDVYISSLARLALQNEEYIGCDDLLTRLIKLELEMYDEFGYNKSMISETLISSPDFDHLFYIDLIINHENFMIYEEYIIHLLDLYSDDEDNLELLKVKINESNNDDFKDWIESIC